MGVSQGFQATEEHHAWTNHSVNPHIYDISREKKVDTSATKLSTIATILSPFQTSALIYSMCRETCGQYKSLDDGVEGLGL